MSPELKALIDRIASNNPTASAKALAELASKATMENPALLEEVMSAAFGEILVMVRARHALQDAKATPDNRLTDEGAARLAEAMQIIGSRYDAKPWESTGDVIGRAIEAGDEQAMFLFNIEETEH